ncbi:hypothetical protein Noda2021_07160 [Candidatus Dependentiae bacterium Noda2021]|nr:hypothetical protein Noda2021_07160 [Candidatus Dependentiae bacterium Noda2021]
MKRILLLVVACALPLQAQDTTVRGELVECTHELKNIFNNISLYTPGIVRPSVRAVEHAVSHGYSVLPASVVHNAIIDGLETIDSRNHELAQRLEEYYHWITGEVRKHKKRKIIDNLVVQQSVKVNNLAVGGTIFGIFANASITGCGGFTAPTGITGLTGFTGNAGSQLLAQGATGQTGVTGTTGLTGLTGFTGLTAPLGGLGDTGNTGNTGSTGLTGFAGPLGARGALGNTGNTGAQGDTGATGTAPIGSLGAAGADGAAGPTGLTGFTGPQGISPQGAPGATGNTGASFAPAFGFSNINGTSNLAYQAVVPYNATLASNMTIVGGTVTFAVTGTYEVTYAITGFESTGGVPTNRIQFYAINTAGGIYEASTYGVGLASSINTDNNTMTGQFIVQVSAGDTLRLVNNTGTAGSTFVLSPDPFGTTVVSTSIYIEQLS